MIRLCLQALSLLLVLLRLQALALRVGLSSQAVLSVPWRLCFLSLLVVLLVLLVLSPLLVLWPLWRRRRPRGP